MFFFKKSNKRKNKQRFGANAPLSAIAALQTFEDVCQYVNALYPESARSKDGEVDSQKFLLMSCVLYLKECCPEQDQVAMSIIKLLQVGLHEVKENPRSTTLDIIFEMLQERPTERAAGSQYPLAPLYYNLFKKSAPRCDHNAVIIRCIVNLLPHVNYTFAKPSALPNKKEASDSEKDKPLYEEKHPEDNQIVADEYQPTMERISEEFYAPSEEDLTEMEGFDDGAELDDYVQKVSIDAPSYTARYDSFLIDAPEDCQAAWDIGKAFGDSVVAAIREEDDGCTLVVFGKGQTRDFAFTSPPWLNKFRLKIKKIVIREGVTSLGSNLFSELAVAETVRVSGSVCSLGSKLFSNCFMLKSVCWEDPVQANAPFRSGDAYGKVERNAFLNCNSLTEISFPHIFSVFDACLFDGCTALTSVTILSNNAQYVSTTFSGCPSLEKVHSFDIECAPSLVRDNLRHFLEFQGVEFELFKPENRVASAPATYKITGNVISISVWTSPYDFKKVVEQATAEYVYNVFALEKIAQELFLKFRFDEYLKAENDFRLDQYQKNFAFANAKNFFIYKFVRQNGATRSPIPYEMFVEHIKNCYHYNNFLSALDRLIYFKRLEPQFESAFKGLVGDSGEKRLTNKQLLQDLNSLVPCGLAYESLRCFIKSLVSKGIVNLRTSGNIQYFSLPKGEESGQLGTASDGDSEDVSASLTPGSPLSSCSNP